MIQFRTYNQIGNRTLSWVSWLTVLAMATIVVGLSTSMLPLRVGDSFFFMPAVVNYSAGEGLRNYGYLDADYTGAGRMVWHGYLPAMLLGSVLWDSSYHSLFLVQGFTAVVTLLLTCVLFSQVIERSASIYPLLVSLSAVMMIIGLVPPLLSGRPEPLATLFVLITVLVLIRIPAYCHPIALGLGLMLVGITSPAAAVLGALITGSFYSYGNQFFAAAIKFAVTMAIAAIGIALATQFVYPFGLLEWIRGLQYHSTRVLGYADVSRVQYWFLNPTAFMYGVWFLTAFACGLLLLYRNFRNVKCLTGLLAFGLLFLWASWRLAIEVSTRQYNLFPFAPLACLLILSIASGPESKAKYIGRWFGVALKLVLLLTVSLPAIGTARLVLHCAISRYDGLGYEAARQIVDKLRRNGRRIALSRELFALEENQHGIEYFTIGDILGGGVNVPDSEYLILQQSKLGVSNPPILKGYELESDYFSHHMYKILGVLVAKTPEAYNLAIYKKTARSTPL